MPNPKLETYKNKATNTVYDLTDANAQSKLTAILDGTNIDSFGDVETAVSALQPKNLSHSIAGENTVESALDAIAAGSGVTVDDAMSSSSTNPVQNKVITSALADKQDTLTFDNFPTTGSTNPVTSGGIKSATTEIWGVIGPIEAGLTSEHAYEVGDHFECYFGYVTVIAPIAVGDTIENNVNVVGGTIASTMTQDAKDAFPRDEQAMLGAENIFDYVNATKLASNTTYTLITDGINVKSSSAEWASLSCAVENKYKNKDIDFVCDLDFVSGHIQVNIYSNSIVATSGATLLASSSSYTADGKIKVSFNSGNNNYLLVRMFVSGGTAEVGEANFTNMMLKFLDFNDDYVPYAMTNKELTEKVQGILSAAANAADFAAFKTALAAL